MHCCLVTPEQILASVCEVDPHQSRHLKTVLRLKTGTTVTLFDGQGHTRQAVINGNTGRGLQLTALTPVKEHPRPASQITLFVCISKGARMDWSIEKSVELGVDRIVPVVSERTIARAEADANYARWQRWQRLAVAAARQSQAIWLTEIVKPLNFEQSLQLARQYPLLLVAALSAVAVPLRQALAAHSLPPASVGWFVGPEGDFAPAELAALLNLGAMPVTLGSRILRAETACLYGLSAITCAWR